MTPSDGYGRRQVLAILSGLLLATFVASLDQTVVAAAMYRIGESLERAHRAGVGDDRVPDHLDDLGPVLRQAVGHPRAQAALPGRHRRVPGRVGAVRVRPARCRCWRPSAPSRASARAACSTLTSAVLGDVVAPRERAKYGGYFVAIYAVASLVGPVTGGALAGQRTLLGVDGWRWIFLHQPSGRRRRLRRRDQGAAGGPAAPASAPRRPGGHADADDRGGTAAAGRAAGAGLGLGRAGRRPPATRSGRSASPGSCSPNGARATARC